MPSKIVHGQNFVIPNYPIENNNFATMGPFQRIDSKTNNLAIIIEETVGHNRKTLVILKTLDFGVTWANGEEWDVYNVLNQNNRQ